MQQIEGLPIIWYRPGQAKIGHSEAIRMSQEQLKQAGDDAYRMCMTALPAVMCECRKFFLACRHENP